MATKELGILFSAPMVHAILAGTKTQTRRAVKMPPAWDRIFYADHGDGWWPYRSDDGTSASYDNNEIPLACPYGQPGDRLWVRETFVAHGRWATRYNTKKNRSEWHFVDMTLACGHAYQYAADNPAVQTVTGRSPTPGWHRRPAIFMPRAASRILLEVVTVRVEPLQEITEADARAEGVTGGGCTTCGNPEPCGCASPAPSAIDAYRHLWGQINGETGLNSWAANPWVWCVSFRRVK